MRRLLDLERIANDEEIRAYIVKADEHSEAIGYTEHGLRHAGLVARIARNILLRLDRDERTAELAAIAGYLHDIGNMVSRHMHGQTGAAMAWHLLREQGMSPDEIASITAAIGNHEEEYGRSVNDVSAALVLADKSDVHHTRVREQNVAEFDLHDRVNYAAKKSFVTVDGDGGTITLELSVDTEISPVMDYFEIFLSRMIMCRRAAEFLGCDFHLTINENALL